ncbi:ATP-dependent RecD-like DNA helicase [Microcoleus sp. IPMA8]|uniref:ATP-dependent RecD-like DNA helicase n=1 Tax=Microcoleus asticus IPMA8 TaxID=2563858 RepID=A0ABX2CZP5_9CYAN|nr:ATP-dependent RecD-like DNA helicase [Microcoleus asticus IPMA8]
MNNAAKVDAILNAWFDYIDLDDYSNARIEAAKVKQRGIGLVGDSVLIEQAIFEELQQKVNQNQQGQQEPVWVLSFPQVLDVERGKSYLCPLFNLEVTSILKGEYREEGWKLDELKLTEAGENVTTFLGLDEKEREDLITQDGLRQFLETTFKLEFQTYEEWMQQVSLPRRQIQRRPYLFEFPGGRFSKNLQQDLKEIESGSKDWSIGHPAYEYLFGVPQLPKHEVIYMGAFPTHAPTNSQLKALKHAQSEPVTAVQGPPGSGKTTLILHLIAQQVVNRALRLIDGEEDINNLTVVSSTNNKAVDNVIEKIDEWLNNDRLEHNFLYLKGGSIENIQKAGCAIEQLKKGIEYIQQHSFNETAFNQNKQKIKQIQDDILLNESNYLAARHQRALDEERLPHLREEIQTLQQHLDEVIATQSNLQQRATDLAEYEQLPIEAYRKIELRFSNAERQMPEGRLPWWTRLWRWITGRTEKQIITKAVLACESAIESTFNTPFPVENPKNRREFFQELGRVTDKLAQAKDLQHVQASLPTIAEDIANTEQQKDEADRELTSLESSLAIPLEDFYASFHEKFHNQHQELFKISREFLTQQALQDKDNVKKALKLYLDCLSGYSKAPNKFKINQEEYFKAISLIFPVISCGLYSVRNMLPRVSECVDRTIIDEAGMIPLHQSFPLLIRSRKAIIVGDPLQIEPVITLSDRRRDNYRQTAFIDKGLTEIDYNSYSPEEEYSATTYHRAAGATGENGNTGNGICLMEHYRCQPSIIQYCNAIAGYNLEIKTEPVDSLLERHLIAYDVEGNIRNNINLEEVTAVCEIIQNLVNQGYSLEDIGVISAFRAQANALEESITKKFPQFKKKSVGTIHNFQGSEKKVIILSTKVCRSQDNVRWINRRPNLLNVAVSRAKELFILVGNLYRLEKAGSYTRQLVEHIRKLEDRELGYIVEYKPQAEIPQQQPGTTVIENCKHLKVIKEAIDRVERELLIVSPWIRGDEPKWFVTEILSVLQKGVKVTVIYGNKSSEDNDNNDARAEKELRDLFTQHPDTGSRLIRLGKELHIESRGTNERTLVCDDRFAVIGSWNWLSHPYRERCRRSSSINPKVQFRRETSIQFYDPSSIADIKKRIIEYLHNN